MCYNSGFLLLLFLCRAFALFVFVSVVSDGTDRQGERGGVNHYHLSLKHMGRRTFNANSVRKQRIPVHNALEDLYFTSDLRSFAPVS